MTLTIHANPIDTTVSRCVDRVGVQLSSALAGDIGGRIFVQLVDHNNAVTLVIRTARPGSWTRALQRSSFDHLLTKVSALVARVGGTLEIVEEPFGRLVAIIRIERPTAPSVISETGES